MVSASCIFRCAKSDSSGKPTVTAVYRLSHLMILPAAMSEQQRRATVLLFFLLFSLHVYAQSALLFPIILEPRRWLCGAESFLPSALYPQSLVLLLHARKRLKYEKQPFRW